MKKTALALCLVVIGLALLSLKQSVHYCSSWGFFAHKKINRLAIFTLPEEMFGFFKANADYITEHSVDADKRRHSVKGEAPKHYIDIDHYGGDSIHSPDSLFRLVPKKWNEAVSKFSKDTLETYGTLPWQLNLLCDNLKSAFETKDKKKILRLAADIGHYVGDAHVPLHTTENYNGQISGQYGIHGFWESRLPELFYEEYDLFSPKAAYQDLKLNFIWEVVYQSHLALDSVLSFEKQLTESYPDDLKMSFEERGTIMTEVYSKEFSTEYHNMLDGMVERRMRSAIYTLGSLWYTCWVDAGQPDLNGLIKADAMPPKLDSENIDPERHPKRK